MVTETETATTVTATGMQKFVYMHMRQNHPSCPFLPSFLPCDFLFHYEMYMAPYDQKLGCITVRVSEMRYILKCMLHRALQYVPVTRSILNTVGISQYNPIQFRILTNQNRRTADYIVKLPTVNLQPMIHLGKVV